MCESPEPPNQLLPRNRARQTPRAPATPHGPRPPSVACAEGPRLRTSKTVRGAWAMCIAVERGVTLSRPAAESWSAGVSDPEWTAGSGPEFRRLVRIDARICTSDAITDAVRRIIKHGDNITHRQIPCQDRSRSPRWPPPGTAAGRRLSWRRPGAPRARVCCARPPRPAGSRSARRMSRATRATHFIRADDRFQVRALRLRLPAAVGPSSTLYFSNLQGVGGGEGGIRTHVPVTRQDAFEAPPLRPLRYLSATERGRRGTVGWAICTAVSVSLSVRPLRSGWQPGCGLIQ